MTDYSKAMRAMDDIQTALDAMVDLLEKQVPGTRQALAMTVALNDHFGSDYRVLPTADCWILSVPVNHDKDAIGDFFWLKFNVRILAWFITNNETIARVERARSHV